MRPPRPLADVLSYLSDLGWSEIYAPAPGRGTASDPGSGGGSGEAASAPDLEAAGRRAETCTRCRLSETRKRVVFGAGHPRARLMFVGEGPGAEEDRQGLPFVGRAGELLTKMIGAIDLDREQVYITNVVKCRPPGNRDPEPDEVSSCMGYLETQIDAIRPSVIVCLGRVAAQTLLGTDRPLGRMRGEWFQVRGVPTRVTYHPAALLRNAKFKRPAWEDLQIVQRRLAEANGAEEGDTE